MLPAISGGDADSCGGKKAASPRTLRRRQPDISSRAVLPADLRHVLRRYLNILPAGDREDGNRDAGQRRARVVGEEVAPPAGVDPEACIRMTSPVDALMRATRLRWVRMMSVRVIFRIILAVGGSRAATISVCQDRISSAGRASPASRTAPTTWSAASSAAYHAPSLCPMASSERPPVLAASQPSAARASARRSSIPARRYSPPLAPTPRLSYRSAQTRAPARAPRWPCPPRS